MKNNALLQVYLDKALHERLRLAAKKQRISQSELVRRYVRRGLENDLGHNDPALDIIGLGDGETSDLAERHDYYLAVREKEKWGK